MEHSRSPLEVTAEQHRLRLDRFLQQTLPDRSRKAISRMLRSGQVLVDGHPRDERYFVKRGDRIVIGEAPAQTQEEPHEILRTTHMAAIAKPPGIPTNPVPGSTRSVLSWMERRVPDISPGIVHRLDQDTSGVVILSLSPDGHRRLESAFAEHAIAKTYLALVPGRLSPQRGTIDRPLLRDASGRMRAAAHGKPSRTTYETITGTSTFSLLEVRPQSGRTHQIRVHLAIVGHPIAGDPLYGDPRHALGAPRLWLHASSLEMANELAAALAAPNRIECPLWDDLRGHLAALGFSAEGR
jgi:23S rRNA pseudouridine1911/1915/1917 synthase